MQIIKGKIRFNRRSFLKCLSSAAIIGATFNASDATAGIDISYQGQLVGRCAAIYDLGLMDDAASRAYFKRVLSAWKSSSQSSIADFNRSYNKTTDTLKTMSRVGNDRGQLINYARRIYPFALNNLTSSIPDPTNAGQSIIQIQQNAEQAASNRYYAKQYNQNQMSQGFGWYIQVRRNFTIKTCVEMVQEYPVFQQTPSAILVANENSLNPAGVYIGPFGTSVDAVNFTKRNAQAYGVFAEDVLREEPFANDGHWTAEWLSGVGLQKQTAKESGNWYVTIPGMEKPNTPVNLQLMKEFLEQLPPEKRARQRIVAIDNSTKVTLALGPYATEEDAKKMQQKWPASLGRTGIFQLPN